MIDIEGRQLLEMRCEIDENRPECDDFEYDQCSYDKLDGEFLSSMYYGYDRANKAVEQRKPGTRRTGRAYRRKMHWKHLKKYISKHGRAKCYGAPYPNYRYVDGKYTMIGSYLVRQKNSNSKVFYKRVSNRKVRHSKEILLKGNEYRKLFDYWWSLY